MQGSRQQAETAKNVVQFLLRERSEFMTGGVEELTHEDGQIIDTQYMKVYHCSLYSPIKTVTYCSDLHFVCVHEKQYDILYLPIFSKITPDKHHKSAVVPIFTTEVLAVPRTHLVCKLPAKRCSKYIVEFNGVVAFLC